MIPQVIPIAVVYSLLSICTRLHGTGVALCLTGPDITNGAVGVNCGETFDTDCDADYDLRDFAVLQNLWQVCE